MPAPKFKPMTSKQLETIRGELRKLDVQIERLLTQWKESKVSTVEMPIVGIDQAIATISNWNGRLQTALNNAGRKKLA